MASAAALSAALRAGLLANDDAGAIDNDALQALCDEVGAAVVGEVAASPLLWEAYDSTGGVNVGSAATVVIDTIGQDSDDVDLAAGVVTINRAGTYRVHGRVTVNATSGTSRSITECYLERDPGDGFAAVPGTYGLIYNREVTEGGGVASFFRVIDLDVGDLLRLRADRISGTSTIETIANGSGLMIEEVT